MQASPSSADLLALLDARPGERVLDAGCGLGEWTARLAESGAIVVGVDCSTPLIEQARAAHPGLEFVAADLLEMEEDELFDAIFARCTLEWIDPPERILRIMFDALKPCGRLAVELGGPARWAALPGVGAFTSMLEKSGFEILSAARINEAGGRLRVLARRPL